MVCAAAACTAQAGPKSPFTEPGRAQILRALDDVVRSGAPGVQVVVTDQGHEWTATAGVGDIATGARFPDDGKVRIGSNTKSFVATVLLQLTAEGRVVLDAPVERYLPGVVRGNGIDGTRITVRNLLQHTSGLADYLDLPGQQVDFDQVRWQRFDAADLVRRAMAVPPHFEPGAKAEYSNTNYLLAGMVVERVTGQPIAAEIDRRIIQPLGLTGTYFPPPGDTGLRDPHPWGYLFRDGHRAEYTDLDPSLYGAAGAMVSTGADLNRFFTALLAGKLLPAAQVEEMRRNAVPVTNRNGRLYGLGLGHISVSCGKDVWGHGGGIPGFRTVDGVATDGRAVTVTVNQLSDSDAETAAVRKAFDAAMCPTP
ncbi:beta-lactamase family protein [Nocardia transvalensis]|nr:beta-lactamase family protein [Nocardia transvalensis]